MAQPPGIALLQLKARIKAHVRDVNDVHTPAVLVADSTSAEIAAFSAEKVKTFGAEHAHARAAT